MITSSKLSQRLCPVVLTTVVSLPLVIGTAYAADSTATASPRLAAAPGTPARTENPTPPASTLPPGSPGTSTPIAPGAPAAPIAAPPTSAPAPNPAASAPSSSAPTAPAAPLPKFAVYEYRVLGNTVLPNRDIEATLYPLLGEQKTIDDVQVAKNVLEKVYHDRGFATVYVDIPDQSVEDGIVRLKVTEARLNSVRIAGARYFSEGKILAAVPAAQPGTVPNFTELQKQLTDVNVQTADRSVIPVLKAGPVPGTMDLALNVNDTLPLHGSLEVNNQYTPSTRVLRVIGGLSYSNLFQTFDALSAQYQVAPQQPSQVNVLALNYAWGALQGAIHPSLYFINSNSNVPTVGTIGVLGKGQIYGARLMFPFMKPTEAIPTQSVTLGIDYKHFRETIGLEDQPAAITPISYVNLSLGYSGMWSSDWSLISLGTSANFGPRGTPNNPTTFANKRYRGRPNYAYLKIDASWTIKLPKDFQLLLRSDGQFAPEALITNEDYSITGADGVRGYLEAEVLADTGYKGSVQFQSPALLWSKRQVGDMFVFFDAGRVDTIDALEGQPQFTELRSYGAGFHVFPGQPVNGLLTWASPLNDGPYTRRGQWRVLFVIRGSF